MKHQSTFIIAREDRTVDPVTLVTDGLTIGKLPDCELYLNHPAVSRVHAGIRETGKRFYIFNLSPSNSTTLNGKLIEQRAALAAGDVLEIGPFFLHIDRADKALVIKVSLQIGINIGEVDVRTSSSGGDAQLPQTQPGPPHTNDDAATAGTEDASPEALDIFWQARMREKGKAARPSPLHPRQQKRLGKAQYNWTPTRDLARPWTFSIFTWGILIVGILSVAAAFSYTSAFSPAPISDPHVRSTLALTPAIAHQPNANSCTSCHTVTTSMQASCSSCHQTEAFVSTVTDYHTAAGISCTSCHAEHKGAAFRPGEAALGTCAECHNDNNKTLYNGRRVGTPHGGTFGYPVVNGKWEWEGVSDEAWAEKQIAFRRLPTDSDDEWRSKQFHAVHLHRLRAVDGIVGNEAGEMSCSSCHRSFNPIDRVTARETCAKCHNGKTDAPTGRLLIAGNVANCTSCHVQHVKDKRHWNPSLLAAPATAAHSTSGEQIFAATTASIR